MTSTEDRLRAAAREVTALVPPGSAPPLRLPPARRRHGWSRGGWLAPAAAAAAVVTVVAASALVTRGQLAQGGHAGTRAGPGGTPPYYVALTAATASGAAGTAAVVRATSTGRPVARVVPPRPYSSFTMVTAADDDRTFVLTARVTAEAAVAGQPPPGPAGGAAPAVSPQSRPAAVTITRFFLLRFDPQRDATRLRPLRLPAQRAAVSGVALSPDGRRLAVALAPPGQLDIMIASLATGASRTWTARLNPGQRSAVLPNYLSWAPGARALAFDWPAAAGQVTGPAALVKESVRLLNTAAPGASLLGDSTILPVVGTAQVAMSPHGQQVIFREDPPPAGAITQYATTILPAPPAKGSIRSPRARIQPVTQLLWTNASGSVLIVSLLSPEIDVLDNGRFARLPATMPENPLGIAW